MKRNLLNRFIALVLSVLFSLPVLPIGIYAEDPDLEPFSTQADISSLFKAIIVEECTDRREECSKHFLCDDGSYVAVLYSNAVHFPGRHGGWENIMPLIPMQTGPIIPIGNNSFGTDSLNPGTISTTVSDYEISYNLSAIGANNNPLSLNINNISFVEPDALAVLSPTSILATKDTAESAVINELNTLESNDILDLSAETLAYIDQINTSIESYNDSVINNVHYNVNTIECANAFDNNTVVRYTFSDESTDMELMFNSMPSINSFSMSFDADNCNYTVDSMGNVIITDTDDEYLMSVSAAYAVDADDNEVNGIVASCTQENDELIVTYTIDTTEFENIEYPVIINSNISVDIENSNIKQASVSSNNPNINYYGGQAFVSRDEVNPDDLVYHYLFLKNLPSMSGKTITGSELKLFVNRSSSSAFKISCFVPGGSWNPDQVTWNNMPTQEHLIVSQLARQTETSGLYRNYYNISLGILPVQWYANSDADKFGITLTPSDNQDGYVVFYKSNSANHKPYFTIYYNDNVAPSSEPLANLTTGYYVIRNSLNYQYLYTKSPRKEAGVRAYTFGTEQIWHIENLGNGVYSFAPYSLENDRLEISCGVYRPYSPVTYYDYTDNLNVSHIKFKIYKAFTLNNTDYYDIRPLNNNNCAITLYTGLLDTMLLYNSYKNKFVAHTRTPEQYCELYTYNGNNNGSINGMASQHWIISQAYVPSDFEIDSSDVKTATIDGVNYNSYINQNLFLNTSSTSSIYNCTIEWSSNNTNVATVTQNGAVSFLDDGVVTISAEICDETTGFCLTKSIEFKVFDADNSSITQISSSVLKQIIESGGAFCDVELISQEKDYYCGAASMFNILNYFGISDYSQSYIYSYSGGTERGYDENGIIEENTPILYRYVNTVNEIFENCDYNKDYAYCGYSNDETGKSQYKQELINSLNEGNPCSSLIKITNSNTGLDAFHYLTNGHYVVINGYFSNTEESNNELVTTEYLIITDPFSSTWGSTHNGQQIIIPLDTFQNAVANINILYLIYSSNN